MVSYSIQEESGVWTIKDEKEEENRGIFQTKLEELKEVPQYPLTSENAFMGDGDFKKWPVSEIKRLLHFYAGHRCLWDLGCADNRNRKQRQAALIDIAAAMDQGFNKNDIVQKINVIRATYRYEKKRIKQRMRRGQGAKTKLKWFALADAFLRNVPKKGHGKEDPRDSDSDLDDAIVYTTNSENIIPFRHNIKDNNLYGAEKMHENNCQLKVENIVNDEAQTTMESSRNNEQTSDDDSIVLSSLIKPKIEMLENEMEKHLKEYNERIKTEKEEQYTNENCGGTGILSPPEIYNQQDIKEESQEFSVSSAWNLQTSFEFIKQLENYPILRLQSRLDDTNENLEFLALNSIANEMHKPLRSITRRWNILKETCEIEKQKIFNNPSYQPPFKWWHEAEMLMETQIEIKTESIYLEENEETYNNSSESEENYEERFQNPIPSVAPMSNMNEAMASLFHDDFSLPSISNSSIFHLETDNSSHSSKAIWNTWEDDLLEGKWSLRHSVKFLRLYGAHECLWNLNDPNYRSRILRNAAIEDIAACMGHGLTAAYVSKKIKIFRITYMQQRKRILEATEKGNKLDIMLKWFPLADSFLRPHIGLRCIKADAKEMPQFDFQYVYANLNLIDPGLLTDFRGKGTQNAIDIGGNSKMEFDDDDSSQGEEQEC